jgi:hypothetical protein
MTSAPFLHVYHPEISRARTISKSGRGIFRQVMDVITESNRRKAEREIGRFIQNNGGQLTDDIERAIERRFL